MLETLRRDLASCFPVLLAASAEEQAQLGAGEATQGVTFVGEHNVGEDSVPRDSLRFTATLSGADRGGRTGQTAPRGDLVELYYALDASPDSAHRGLTRRCNEQAGLSAPEAEPAETLLTPLASSLRLRYYTDQDRPDGTPAGWVDDWQDAQALPLAVAVTLGLTARDGADGERFYDLVVPLTLRSPAPPPAPAKAGGTP